MNKQTRKDTSALLAGVALLNDKFSTWNTAAAEDKQKTAIDLAYQVGAVKGLASILQIDLDVYEQAGDPQ